MSFRRSIAVLAVAVISATGLVTTASPAEAAPAIRIARVQYNSPGSDTGSNRSLNREWIKITNHGRHDRTLTGWRIHDRTGYLFVFPRFTLRSGYSVWVHTGSGTKDRKNLYWDQGWYIWNNTGDKATLKNKLRQTVDTCKWGDGSGSKAC